MQINKCTPFKCVISHLPLCWCMYSQGCVCVSLALKLSGADDNFFLLNYLVSGNLLVLQLVKWKGLLNLRNLWFLCSVLFCLLGIHKWGGSLKHGLTQNSAEQRGYRFEMLKKVSAHHCAKAIESPTVAKIVSSFLIMLALFPRL